MQRAWLMLSLVLLMILPGMAWGQGTMGRWEMCGLSGTTSTVSPTGVNSNVTFSVLSRGAGLTGASITNGYSSTGWSTSGSLSTSNNDYYEFTITPNPGYKISISAIKIRDYKSDNNSSFDAYLRFSDDAYANNVINSWQPSNSQVNRTLNTSGVAALQNRTTAVTFRIYATDADAAGDRYILYCQGTAPGNYRGVDIDGTVTQIAYASQFISMNTGAATWCAGETRDVTVTVKNVGSAAWADAGGNDFNVGVKWNADADYFVRTDVGNLAPGATGTFTLPMTAPGTGTNNLTFDIVYVGQFWFGNTPGNSAYASPVITIAAAPAQPGAINQPANKCAGSTGNTFSISAVSGATSYTWSVTGTGWSIPSPSATTSVNVTIGTGVGTVSVTANNGSCISAARTTGNITPTTVPAQPSLITGSTTPCQGSSQTYSVTNVSGVTYTWVLPSGWTGTSATNSITVTVGATSGNVQVTPSNTCGSGTPQALAVTVSPLPAAAGTISGTTPVCQGATGVAYSVGAIANATGYVWTLPGGATIASGSNTNSITVDYSGSAVSGNITVRGTNACGNGTVSTNYAVTVNTPPVFSSHPSNQAVCASGGTAAFTVVAVDGSLTYKWQENTGSGFTDITNGGVYSGATLATLSISNPPLSMSGYTYRCVVNGNCPPEIISNPATLMVTVAPTVAVAGDDQLSLCGASTTLAANTPTVGTGAWSIQSGAGGSFGNASSPTSTFSGNAGTTYTLRWTISNPPCTASTSDVVIEFLPGPAAAGTISGTTPICAGISGVNYSVPEIAGATSYNWSYSGNGATINGNGSSVTIDFSSDVTAGNLTVKGVNDCGEGPASLNFAIAVTASPVITTNVTICTGEPGSAMTVTSNCPDLNNQNTGAKNAGTGVASGSGSGWSNLPSGVTANDNSNATSTGNSSSGNDPSQALNATGYDFSTIPSNATINGIQVTIGRYRSGGYYGNIQDNSVRLIKAGSVVGTNMGATSTNWPTSETPANYGANNDLWGTSWTIDEIKASNFGVQLIANFDNYSSRVANVDYMQITVTYSVPGNITWYTQSSGGTIVQTGTTLNPIGDAEVLAQGGIYANLSNTNTPNTYRFFAECSSTPGCRAATDFVINALPTFTVLPTHISCFDEGDGAIIITPAGGSGTGYQYRWRSRVDGSSPWSGWSGWINISEDFDNLGPADYEIQVQDSNGCIQTVCN